MCAKARKAFVEFADEAADSQRLDLERIDPAGEIAHAG
jgi:hypothetical protein